jgi:hypothetical protein
MLFAFGDHSKSRQMAIVIQQQMKLHGSFGPAELGPVEYGQTAALDVDGVT